MRFTSSNKSPRSRGALRTGVAAAVFAACAAVAPANAATEEKLTIGGVDAVVWSAQESADSNCTLSLPALSRNGSKPSLMWSDGDFRDRADDVRAVVKALSTDRRFAGRVDIDRLALVGHSLGGYTVLGLGGAWPSWRLDGVRAILALTPYALPFQRNEGLRKIAAPVMYHAGTLDPVFTLPLHTSGYAQTPAPKYLVEFATAAHMTWTDFGFYERASIVDYAIAFFDHYVREAPAGPALASKLPGVFRFARDVR